MIVWLERGLVQLRDCHVRGGQVGVPEPEIDDVLPRAAQLERQVADRRKHVRRQRVDATELHLNRSPARPRPWTTSNDAVAPQPPMARRS